MSKRTNYGHKDCAIAVWEKATVIKCKNPKIWRKDSMGKTIKFADLKSKTSLYAWNIDHIIPKTRGGSDEICNLQPLNRTDNIKFSNKLTRDKPNYSKRIHFNLLLQRANEKIKKNQNISLQVGTVINARQSPTVKVWKIATVVYANKKEDIVIVNWTDGKYNEDLVYDIRLFELLA